MNKETHYLHVSYMVTLENVGLNYGDLLIATQGTLDSVREDVRRDIIRNTGFEVTKIPVIISMTELSESLYKTLNGE